MCSTDATYPTWTRSRAAASSRKTVPALNALNERLRDDYIEDAARASTAGTR